jgi:predicted nucleic acid-binding protein
MNDGLSAWYLQRLQAHDALSQLEQFSSRFEEKYLSRRITIEPIRAQDVSLLLLALRSKHDSLDLTVPITVFQIDAWELTQTDQSKLKKALEIAEELVNRSIGEPFINVRKFIGVLYERLQKLAELRGDPDDLIAVVALEYYRIFKAAGKLET